MSGVPSRSCTWANCGAPGAVTLPRSGGVHVASASVMARTRLVRRIRDASGAGGHRTWTARERASSKPGVLAEGRARADIHHMNIFPCHVALVFLLAPL